jgi:hypothetical protein
MSNASVDLPEPGHTGHHVELAPWNAFNRQAFEVVFLALTPDVIENVSRVAHR